MRTLPSMDDTFECSRCGHAEWHDRAPAGSCRHPDCTCRGLDNGTSAFLPPSQRPGQAAFNALYASHPAVADAIRGTDADPFHHDERLNIFYRTVVLLLDTAASPGEDPLP